MNEQVEVWSRRFVRPRIDFLRPARPHPLAAWNRYGAIPGTPFRGVTIGMAFMWRGRGVGIRWARPQVHFEEAR
ncbi:hypothetical protein [Actinomadura rupiterrae]|uniref:hypothetical protein n=1 Tax=Actinomadura rupiterrae TaxID=559627 RepID=UPI0020A397B1|nr:hypothetical protein [Actinomadura rupiterrae]MCP2339190.1 hypothetical protein [Actinomadura rupiterrae]